MLRRLFIGLLILSALTSEGAALLVFNTMSSLYPESSFNLCSESSTPEDQVANSQNEGVLDSVIRYQGSVIAPLEEYLEVHAVKNQTGFTGISVARVQYNMQTYACNDISPVLYNKDITTISSDVSPPNFSRT